MDLQKERPHMNKPTLKTKKIISFSKAAIESKDMIYFIRNNEVLVKKDETYSPLRLPLYSELDIHLDKNETVFELPTGWAMSGHDIKNNDYKSFEKNGFTFKSLRDVLPMMPQPISLDMTLAAQYTNWSSQTLYCSYDGELLKVKDFNESGENEISKYCQRCKKNYYPQLSPVVIVLIRRGRQALLIKGLPPKKFYTCVAGFVEPGESLEQTLRREIKEEVGLDVKGIKYFGSQPWPFPNNLMIGFFADWVAGEVKIDDKEITDAQWFDRNELPEQLPPKSSISRQLIESFRASV